MKNYKVIIKVQNEPGVLARISILLRKFNVNIKSIDAKPIPAQEGFTEIHINLETNKTPQGFETVIKKLENLVPVVEISYEKN